MSTLPHPGDFLTKTPGITLIDNTKKSKFRLVCKKLLLTYNAHFEEEIFDQQVKLPDAELQLTHEAGPYTHILLNFEDGRFENKNPKIFDITIVTDPEQSETFRPRIWKIDGRRPGAWRAAEHYAKKDGQGKVKPSVAESSHQPTVLTQAWQQKACEFLLRDLQQVQVPQADILNMYCSKPHDSIMKFCNYMKDHHPTDSLVFSSGFGTHAEVKRQIQKARKELTWSGFYLIVVLPTLTTKEWERQSKLLQSLRVAGSISTVQPHGILLLSSVPITYGNLSQTGVDLLDIDTPDLLDRSQDPKEDDFIKNLFGGATTKPVTDRQKELREFLEEQSRKVAEELAKKEPVPWFMKNQTDEDIERDFKLIRHARENGLPHPFACLDLSDGPPLYTDPDPSDGPSCSSR